jgi:hypothetical protein
MPEFTTVSVQEAQLRTIPGRQGRFIKEYVDYIQQVSAGQAGTLHVAAGENPMTIRRRLVAAAQAMHITLIIKRSGNDLYFWREAREDEQPRSKRSYTRRSRGEGKLPPPDQPADELGMVEQGIAMEESPEVGQTEQVVEDAMQRVDPE